MEIDIYIYMENLLWIKLGSLVWKTIWILSVLFIWYWGLYVYFVSDCVYNGFLDVRLDSSKICESLGKNEQLPSYF